MEYWKNITITLPGHDLKEIADQLIELNILSVSILEIAIKMNSLIKDPFLCKFFIIPKGNHRLLSIT